MKQKKLTTAQRLATLEKVVSLIYDQLTDVKEGLRLTETVLKNSISETPEEKQKRLKDKFEKVGNKTKS